MSTNACKLCTPLGAALAFHGLEKTVCLLHGSQGCSTYIRRYLISHFKEPLDIASTNFSEEAAIYGGRDNLERALFNLTQQYQPALIGLATTCLAETIGDDVGMFLREIGRTPEAALLPPVVTVSTASYRGTHIDGFHAVVKAVAGQVAQGGTPLPQVNVFPGMVSPADLRHLKELFRGFGLKPVLVPDYSETLDGGLWKDYQPLPQGGTPLADLKSLGRSQATYEFGPTLAGQETGGTILSECFGVPLQSLAWPMGIKATDRLMASLAVVSGKSVASTVTEERARLVDAYADAHKYLFGQRAVVYGEEDFVLGLCAFLAEVGVIPVLVASGGHSGKLEAEVRALFPKFDDWGMQVADGVDFEQIEDRAREQKPDLILGHSKGYKMSQSLGLPLIRVGFPIHDRFGGQRLLHLGYRGAQNLLDTLVNTLLDRAQAANPVGYTYL